MCLCDSYHKDPTPKSARGFDGENCYFTADFYNIWEQEAHLLSLFVFPD